MDKDAVERLNPLLTDRVRLVIMVTLASAGEPMSFRVLLDKLQLTRGNLSTHLRRLEEAGMVKSKKTFVERKPLSTYECTGSGRQEIKAYLGMVEEMLAGLN